MAGGNVPPAVAPLFQQAGAQARIPPAILAGIASVESNFGQNQGPSSAGAVGFMQFMPATAKGLGINPLDTRQAIFGAAKLLNQYGYQQNPTRAIAAYNAGPGNYQAGLGYAQQVMGEANRVKGQLGNSSGGMPGSLPPLGTGTAAQSTGSTSVFDQAGFNKANARFIAGSALSSLSKNNPFGKDTGPNPLFSTGLLTTTAPDPANFTMAQSSLQRLAGAAVLNAHPAVKAATGRQSNVAGGFLPQGAPYRQGRKDQGRDGQTTPGGPLVANGKGFVVNVLSNPGGFGPSYPVIHYISGPYAGRTLYFGHTLSAVKPGQQINPGQVISHTGTTPVGNASVPGWFEIGYADSGSPGPNGQAVPF